MLGFKLSTGLFISTILILVLLDIQLDISLWIYLIPVLVFVSMLIIGSAKISSGFFLPVTCHGSKESKNIAITFDDGPLEKFTPEILEILKQSNAPATFFCIGKNIREQPDLIKKMDREGHLVGNHSYSHSIFFDFFSKHKISKELNEVNELVQTIIQKELKYFRPPYGVTTPNIAKAVDAGGFTAIGWTVRSLDTLKQNRELLLKRTLEKINSGDIILFHDSEENTLSILQEFIDKVRQRGFHIVRLDQLINLPAYA